MRRGLAATVGFLAVSLALAGSQVADRRADPDGTSADLQPISALALEPGPALEPRLSPQPDPAPEVMPSSEPTPELTPETTPAPALTPPQTPPGEPSTGRLVWDTFYSQAMQSQRYFDIYLPPSYDTALDRGYPVLYLLHGDDGSRDSWASLGLPQKMNQFIANGGPELIVIMPDGSGHYNDLTDWANRWDGTDRVEDGVLELIGVVDTNYRTMPDRSKRFIGGLSSGGFGALNIGLRHPELFSTVMSFSGFIAADDPQADPGVFGTDSGYIRQNSPNVLVQSQPGGGSIYYVLSGGQNDPYFRGRMAEFSDELNRLGIADEFHVVPGGHDGTAWNAGLDYGLADLARQIPAENSVQPRQSQEPINSAVRGAPEL